MKERLSIEDINKIAPTLNVGKFGVSFKGSYPVFELAKVHDIPLDLAYQFAHNAAKRLDQGQAPECRDGNRVFDLPDLRGEFFAKDVFICIDAGVIF